MHDFTVFTLVGQVMRVEVKTIRNTPKPKVELQKTRSAQGDPSSRYYDRTHFDVVAACMGRLTGDWSQFRYALTASLPTHRNYSYKLQVMHNIPDLDIPALEQSEPRWFSRFQDVINVY